MASRVDFRYLNFKVYKDAKALFHQAVTLTSKYSRVYWELGDQTRRCSLSVVLNIAEGSAKKSDKEFNRFIKIALGSINEFVACIDVAFEAKLINESKFEQLKANALAIASQLGGFSKTLR